ncbi:MAG TPA: response regulator [Candidatus Limnocylindria bacterium]|nr:response regulator [Candidatus Limnocylindria bacterium]
MGRILVADDDPAIRALLTELLSDEGYDVLEAVDGRAAVEIALARQPQVILMDLRMPHLDGIDATRALKADPRADGIRIIAMSAGYNLRSVADQLPADSLIAKPFDLDALLADVAVQLHHADSAARPSLPERS